MPEINDAMYCRQQISIPPTFPYLLRQYAKAAIRSQPADLLRWSSAYFRALALGVTPPCKLRLEYPIPKMHYGLTPGWLKTLLHQLAGSQTVSWPQLYDRWKGACLQINGLKEILLLADFRDPIHIPWFRFVAVAAGHLTRSLTNTMILVCELLTEEPEGSSAIIPYATFADLYRFLAKIDASDTRVANNYFFTESNLNLVKIDEPVSEPVSEKIVEDVSIIGETIPDMTHLSDLKRYLATIGQITTEEDMETPKSAKAVEEVVGAEIKGTHSSCYIILDPEEGKICKEDHTKEDDEKGKEGSKEGSKGGVSSEESSDTSEIVQVQRQKSKVSSAESEEAHYSDLEIISEPSKNLSSTISSTMSFLEQYELLLPAVLGIGPVVPLKMVEDVLKFMRNCAKTQQGMVMPRNIRHFMCPPLEVCEE